MQTNFDQLEQAENSVSVESSFDVHEDVIQSEQEEPRSISPEDASEVSSLNLEPERQRR